MEDISTWLNENIYMFPYILMLLIVTYITIVCISFCKKFNIFENETKKEIERNHFIYLQKIIEENVKGQLNKIEEELKLMEQSLYRENNLYLLKSKIKQQIDQADKELKGEK